jgi:hypothetical protein
MSKRITVILSRLAREVRASEVAEAALVLPLMFMILLGIFWFGQAFRIYGTITHAAREGARAAVAPVCATCPAAGNPVSKIAYDAVTNALAPANLKPAQLSRPATIPNLVSCNGGGPVPCDSTPTNVCVQEHVQLSNTGSPGVCGVSVSFQWCALQSGGQPNPACSAFHFAIPFTGLDLQHANIRAQAQMRMETQ